MSDYDSWKGRAPEDEPGATPLENEGEGREPGPAKPRRMNYAEYRRRVLALVSEALEGGVSEERDSEALALFGDGLWVTHDFLPALRRPPPLCATCIRPFRTALPSEARCFRCREQAREVAEREALGAEIREQLARRGGR